MKRHGNLYPQIICFENLLLAAKKAQQSKRFRPNILAFHDNLESELLQLQRELCNRTYTPGAYRSFRITDPKPRLISAAPYRDRVVHHALCNIIGPIFERTFIFDSYANRCNFGTHKALRRFTKFARSSCYILQCDIRKYFPSIDLAILKQLVRHKIKCSATLWLIDTIIDGSNPQEFILQYFPGDDLLTPLERRKGLPIGNLTSQFFANVYLNPLDRFIKDTLGATKYLRYVDDFALFSDDRDFLRAARQAIEVFLVRLRLKLHPIKTQLFETKHGANFVGYRVLKDRIRIVSKNIRCGRKRLRQLADKMSQGKVTPAILASSVQAWKGHLQHADTWHLQQQLFDFLAL